MEGIIEYIINFIKTANPYLIANAPELQLGTTDKPLLFAKFLPNVLSDSNVIDREILRLTEVVADDGTNLSQPQIKTSAAMLPVFARLGHVDAATQMLPQMLKTLGNLLRRNDLAGAEDLMIKWLIKSLRMALESKAEIQRCQALTTGKVLITNRDGETYTIDLRFPPDFQYPALVWALNQFYSTVNDPIIDLLNWKLILNNRGMEPKALICGSRMLAVMLSSPRFIQRSGGLLVQDGRVINVAPTLSLAVANQILISNGLPPLTIYDRRYHVQGGHSYRYFPEDAILMVGDAGDEWDFYPAGENEELRNSLLEFAVGYMGIGVSTGQSQPGAVLTVTTRVEKPVGVYAEIYREQFPVVLRPDALIVGRLAPNQLVTQLTQNPYTMGVSGVGAGSTSGQTSVAIPAVAMGLAAEPVVDIEMPPFVFEEPTETETTVQEGSDKPEEFGTETTVQEGSDKPEEPGTETSTPKKKK